MDEATETSQIVLSMLDFLGNEYRKTTTSSDAKESIEVAIQCLETAFNTNLRDHKYKGKTGLREMFHNANSSEPSFGAGQNPFAQFLGGFPQAAAATAAARPPTDQNDQGILGDLYAPTAESTPEQKTRADEHKTLGNDQMKNGDFTGALNAYTEAINLD